jgi:Rrf2 family protein
MLSPLTGYAAMALGFLAVCKNRSASVDEMARGTGIKTTSLSKVVHLLSRKRLVTTRRGVGGGATLACDPRQVTLYDLCLALDDPAILPRCMLGVAPCTDERACPAHEHWSCVRKQNLDFLQRTTVQDVGEFDAARGGLGQLVGVVGAA